MSAVALDATNGMTLQGVAVYLEWGNTIYEGTTDYEGRVILGKVAGGALVGLGAFRPLYEDFHLAYVLATDTDEEIHFNMAPVVSVSEMSIAFFQ